MGRSAIVARAGLSLLFVGAGGGCRPPEPCAALLAAEQPAKAAAHCERLHRVRPTPINAARLARALVAATGSAAQGLALIEPAAARSDAPEVWRALGATRWAAGQRSTARAATLRAAALYEREGDAEEAAASYYEAFRYAYGADELVEALGALEHALELATREGVDAVRRKALLAYFALLQRVGDLEGARHATELAKDAVPEDDAWGQACLLNNEGVYAMQRREWTLARRMFEQAIDYADRHELEVWRYNTRHNLAQTLLDMGEADAAAPVVAEVLSGWPARGKAPGPPSKALLEGRLYAARGDQEAALKRFRGALATEPSFAYCLELETRIGMALDALGRPAEARAAYERAVGHIEALRAELPLDRFKAGLLGHARMAFERLFRSHLRAGRLELAAAVVERSKGRTFIEAFHRSAQALAHPSARDFAGSRRRVNELLELVPILEASEARASRPWAEVWAAVRDAQVLMWFVAEARVHLIVVRAGTLEIRELGSAEGLERLVARARSNPEEDAHAEALGARLLPEDLAFDPSRPVVLVPDGPLGKVPLGWVRHRGRRLVESYTLTYAASLGALALPARARTPYGPPRVLSGTAGLAEAREEVIEVARRLEVSPVSSARRRDLFAPPTPRILHLAGHAGLDPVSAWLELSDGPIYPSDVVRAGAAPWLVVLASCASTDRWGSELWGSMGAAFLAAGATHVVGTTWSVTDTAARRFVELFYAEGGAHDPLGAVTRARRVLIERGAPAEAWAPFVHLGSLTERAPSRTRQAPEQ